MADVILEQSAPKPASPIKLVTIVFGIFALVGVSAYAGYWYGKNSQTPISSEKETTATEKVKEELPSVIDETARWKTYTGAGLEFKYPFDWAPNLDEMKASYIVALKSPSGSVFGVRYEPLSYGIPCVEEIYRVTPLVGGVSATETVSKPSSSQECPKVEAEREYITVKLAKNQKNFLIDYEYNAEKSIDERSLFNLLLSTFRFE